MLRSLKSTCVLLLIGLGVQQASAFSLLGEFDAWQTAELGFGFGELGGSKDLGEEYRINTPTMTYAFDSTFLDYFGAQGVKAVDQAFAIMNKLPSVSKMSPDLSEFLLQDAQLENETAVTLRLLDLKSMTLGHLLEHIGLAGEEHVFDLQKRIPLPGGACQFDYQVVIRNFDPITYEYSRYVNGVYYGYRIDDSCPAASIAFANEIAYNSDPLGIPFNAVASFKNGLRFGGYYISLTRDDAGGLRYIYSKLNYNNEFLPTNAIAAPFSGPWQPVDVFQTNSVATNTLALRPGIEKLRFKKTKYVSLFGSVFRPVVQSYKVPVVVENIVNGKSSVQQQNVKRLMAQPDIVFTAGNLNTPPAAIVALTPFITARSISFITNGLPSVSNNGNIGQPGTIAPQTTITFHKASPQFYNTTPNFLTDTATLFESDFLWGSFDGSTNAPIVYPQGTSIRTVENQVLHGRF